MKLIRIPFTVLCLALVGSFFSSTISALDTITYKRNDKTNQVEGRILSSAQDGGRLLQTEAGDLWAFQPEEVIRQSQDKRSFTPKSQDEYANELLKALPHGFKVHKTAHYVVCYNTTKAYAVWCGSLLERLHKAFTNYWSRRGFKLKEPEFPLPVVIFSSASGYQTFAKPELGDTAKSIIGYYSMQNNRVIMYDLTGTESLRQNQRAKSSKKVSRILSQPAAAPLVATVIHEATHQIAFNSGLQMRFADNPLWYTEGLAIYFESPDLSSSRGWKGIGNVNRTRLTAFKAGLQTRETGTFESLIATDKAFRNTQTAPTAYAKAWALNYYLIRKHSKAYRKYMKIISEKPPVQIDSPQKRLADFKAAFGNNLSALEQDFLSYMQKVR